MFAVLIDPDQMKLDHLAETVDLAQRSKVDLFFVGGSLLIDNRLEDTVRYIKRNCDIPVVLFPGNNYQICNRADAILLLSLISGRNPDLLIGQHVRAAPQLYKTSLDIIPTGYLLIDGGVKTSVAYMSDTTPIPADKAQITIATALAGQQLGMKMIYLDAGSGAIHPVSPNMISALKKYLEIPVIVGGGIRTAQQTYDAVQAGADIVVVGNALEKKPDLLAEMLEAVRQGHKVSNT